MRRLLRSVRWIIKSALLLIALLAIAVWIIGTWRHGSAALSRFAVESQRVDAMGFVGYFEEGRMGIGLWRDHYTDGWLASGNHDATSHGRGWQVTWQNERPGWIKSDWRYHLGSIGWENFGWARVGIVATRRVIAAPCWLVALLTGAWPMFGLVRIARQRRKIQRRARLGQCKFCGYDLRATPAEDGPLLELCPECGKAGGKKPRGADTTRERAS